MGRLVYHNLSDATGSTSPFDAAVLEVARTGHVSIVSPYVGVDYLRRIIQVSDSWRLISDVEAWLSSLSVNARPKAWLFIRENIERIHHCPAIHAKAIISQKLAMFGSANLTNMGMLGRTEMSILIDDLDMVAELGAWFDGLWSQTLPPIADEASAFVQWLDEEAERTPSRRGRFALSSSTRKVRARLVKFPPPVNPAQPGEPLNLAAVAQILIHQEHRHYDSLSAAVDAAVDALAKGGTFYFRQVVVHVSGMFTGGTIREIYFLLLQHCANHVRSVFAENTINRLILTNSGFCQSRIEKINAALEPFDHFLSQLIQYYDFSLFRDAPDEAEIESLTGVNGGNQIILMAELIDCGFLDIDDIPGHLPLYKLRDDFAWDGRYKLFASSMRIWLIKKNTQPSAMLNTPESDDDSEWGDLSRDKDSVFNTLYVPDSSIQQKPIKPKLHVNATKRHNLKPRLQATIDSVFTYVLSCLFGRQKLQIPGVWLSQLARKNDVGEDFIVFIVTGKRSGVPAITLLDKDGLSINPNLNWEELVDYPKAQEVCRSFLAKI